jgi:hypothetical protein
VFFAAKNPYRISPGERVILRQDDFTCAISKTNLDAVETHAEWSVLPYLVADNNLAASLFDVVLELQSIGSNEHVHLCMFFDGPFITDTFFARLNAGSTLTEDIILRFTDLKSNSPDILKEIVRNGMMLFPADHRLVVLAGHGNGWMGMLPDEGLWKAYAERGMLKIITNDLDALLAQNDTQLRAVIQQMRDRFDPESRTEGNPISIILMNACFMGNLEAVASLAGTTAIIIASEDADIAETYDYRAIIRHLSLHPSTTGEELAKILIETRHSLAATGIQVPSHSAYRTSELPQVLAKTAALAKALDEYLAQGGLDHVSNAIAGTFHVASREYKDLKGIALNLQRNSQIPRPLLQACQEIEACLGENCLLLATDTPGGRMSPNGLSIYCPPPGSYRQEYRSYLEQSCPALLPWQEFLVHWHTQLQERSHGSRAEEIWG